MTQSHDHIQSFESFSFFFYSYAHSSGSANNLRSVLFCCLFVFLQQRIENIIVRTEILLTFMRRSEKVEIICAFGRRIYIVSQFVESWHEPILELNKEPTQAKEQLKREFIEIAGGTLVTCAHTVYMAFVHMYIFPTAMCSFTHTESFSFWSFLVPENRICAFSSPSDPCKNCTHTRNGKTLCLSMTWCALYSENQVLKWESAVRSFAEGDIAMATGPCAHASR